MGLVEELEKIVELEKYKKGFLSYLSRYLHTSFGLEYKYAQKYATKSFGSWFLDGIRNGKIIDFLPTEDILRVRDLKYLAHRMGKDYGGEGRDSIPQYKPFVFVFKLKRRRHVRYSPNTIKTISPDGMKVTLKINNPYPPKSYGRGTRGEGVNTSYYCRKCSPPRERSITIRGFQYRRLEELYRGPPGFLDDNVFILLMQYNFIGTKNNHLSVPPQLLSPETTELFGSPLNTISDSYCSALPIDRAFGSMGSFFNLTFTPGTYLANPPFIEDIMTEMARKLLHVLDNVSDLIIFVVMPVWSEGAEERGVGYVAWDLIKESPYLRGHKLLDQDEYPFYDYYRDTYIPVTDTHLVLLSNVANPDIQEYLKGMIKKWNSFRNLIK